MNRINQVITIDKQACSVRAKEIFGKISGLDHKSGGKFQRMKKDGDEIRALVEERIDAKVIYSYYEDFSFDGKVVTIDGVEFSCNAFEQLDKSKIKGVYLYMLTAGDFYLEDEPILRQVYADLWG
ncbi:MAG: hypothetical protein RR661_03410, partial [Anaerovoracaceae bacterium]